MKSKLMPSIVLSAICLVVALLLSAINLVTAPVIEEQQRKKAEAALAEVLPDGENFETVTIMDENGQLLAGLPTTLKEAKSCDKGYVFQLVVTGYKPGLTIMVGIGSDGKITGAKHIASNETYGFEDQLNSAYVGKDADSISKIIASGATANSLTSQAYYTAMTDALAAFAALTSDGGN